jgi:hypothetical protein
MNFKCNFTNTGKIQFVPYVKPKNEKKKKLGVENLLPAADRRKDRQLFCTASPVSCGGCCCWLCSGGPLSENRNICRLASNHRVNNITSPLLYLFKKIRLLLLIPVSHKRSLVRHFFFYYDYCHVVSQMPRYQIDSSTMPQSINITIHHSSCFRKSALILPQRGLEELRPPSFLYIIIATATC